MFLEEEAMIVTNEERESGGSIRGAGDRRGHPFETRAFGGETKQVPPRERERAKIIEQGESIPPSHSIHIQKYTPQNLPSFPLVFHY